MSGEAGTRDRLALASVLCKNGEDAWKSEIASHVWRNGGMAYRECSTHGVKQADLVVADEVFEVKSKIWDYTTVTTMPDTEKWFGEDLKKLQRGTARGYQLITVATLIDAVNLRFRRPGSR